MPAPFDHTEIHRTAKVFMDTGRASSYEEAIALLKKFALTIYVGKEIAQSASHQTALLTLINVARRTLLGGVKVVGLPDANCISPLYRGHSLHKAVKKLHGKIVNEPSSGTPSVVIGSVDLDVGIVPRWRLTWEGWRGGTIPLRDNKRLAEDGINPLAPLLAAAACAAEVFSFLAEDHQMAGRRPLGLSLWAPGKDWLLPDATEPKLENLPSKLWIIGLGNLGQAFAWCLACLPYGSPAEVQLLLQDYDRIAKANDSTSLLSFLSDKGRRKARVVAKWLDERGFESLIEERRFGKSTRRADGEPGVALCGVDNALARAELGEAGFDLIVEAGLGAGPQAFRSIAMHTFPSSRTPSEIWLRQVGQSDDNYEEKPAYQKMKKNGMDDCGLAQLASRTVGVPFVGLVAGCLAFSELLRRLNGGTSFEVVSLSMTSPEDVELAAMQAGHYEFGHLPVI